MQVAENVWMYRKWFGSFPDLIYMACLLSFLGFTTRLSFLVIIIITYGACFAVLLVERSIFDFNCDFVVSRFRLAVEPVTKYRQQVFCYWFNYKAKLIVDYWRRGTGASSCSFSKF